MNLRSVFRLAGVLLPIGILTAALVDLRPWRPIEPRIRTDHQAVGAIRAGAGKAPVDLPRGIPLAGYRPFGRPAGGPNETTYARTLLLESGGVRTGIVLLELMTMPASLSDRIARRLRSEGIECALVAATHSHSGPGAYDRAFVPQAVAVGRFDPAVETALVDAVHASLMAAMGELSGAILRAGEERVRIAVNRDREGEPVDDRLTRVEVLREDGTPIATILRASAHPTIAPRQGLSGDWPGVVMRGLEEEGGIGFVLPGLGCRMAEFGLPPPDLSAMVPRPFSRLLSNLAVPFAPRTSRVVELRLGSLTLLGVPAEPTAAVGRRLEDVPGRTVRTVGLVGDYAGYAVEPADMEDRVFSARNAWFGAELAERLERVRERLLEPATDRRRPEASAP